jgi:hypothetical protein
MENITIRLAPGFVRIVFKLRNRSGSIKPTDNAAFGVQPQGYGRRIDWRKVPEL